MGVYIKGLNKKDISDLRVHKYGGAYEFVENEDIIEVKTPHGRLIDAEVCKQRVYDGSRTPYNVCPTVIEAEVK